METILLGLKNLEHRGYDSMGMALGFSGKKVEVFKISEDEKPGFSVADLRQKVGKKVAKCSIGIGHTRWATFGGKTTKNAHPHHDVSKDIFVVHNGNVENFDELKKGFPKTKFYSETDTELIANLIAREMEKSKTLKEAVEKTIKKLEGANVILVMRKNNLKELVTANKGGTLILGKDQSRILISSDPFALDYFGASSRVALESGEIAVIKKDGWKIEKMEKKNGAETEIDENILGKFQHFMEKEIFEQPKVIVNAMAGRISLEEGTTHLGG
ncbi:MAG: class II glutamine amidotransferase, partial [Ignavibacteria bacterium]|nr:class II glutamine amidotransferase [Ignavibacteria bacterium]